MEPNWVECSLDGPLKSACFFYVDRNYTKGTACPQVSKRYNWNIVESGVKHDKPHHPYLKSECDQMLMLSVL